MNEDEMMAPVVETSQLDGTVSDLSIWNLLIEADIVVQIVMGMLLIASLWSWAIIFGKIGLYRRVANLTDQFEDEFWSGQASVYAILADGRKHRFELLSGGLDTSRIHQGSELDLLDAAAGRSSEHVRGPHAAAASTVDADTRTPPESLQSSATSLLLRAAAAAPPGLQGGAKSTHMGILDALLCNCM